MKIYLFSLITIFILTTSCKEKDTSEVEVNAKNSTTELESQNENNSQDTTSAEQFIENDHLVSQMESDLDEIILRHNFTVEKEPTENRHIQNKIDTIVTRTFNNSEIESYKTNGKEMIYRAKISDADFEFLNSVQIGSAKSALEKQIGTELKSDLIKIGNFTRNMVFIFKFENEKLQEIIYDGYVD